MASGSIDRHAACTDEHRKGKRSLSDGRCGFQRGFCSDGKALFLASLAKLRAKPRFSVSDGTSYRKSHNYT